MIDVGSIPLPANVALFVICSTVVWLAGTRVTARVSEIAERTKLGAGFVGMLLLGGITSLPEAATSLTASIRANAPLAVNNLLGGVTMQVVILALADVVLGARALSSVVAPRGALLQAGFGIAMLGMVVTAIVSGEASIGGVGAWTAALLPVFLGALYVVHRFAGEESADARPRRRGSASDRTGLSTLLLRTALLGAVILVAGSLLTLSAESLAEQTGLGAGFVGVALLAVATSLPEVSSVLAAMRLRQYELAVGDIFGTNLFDILLIAVIDIVYRGGPVLSELGTFSLVATSLGIAVTAVYAAGLLVRRRTTLLRMGFDSWLVLAIYLVGLIVLYRLR